MRKYTKEERDTFVTHYLHLYNIVYKYLKMIYPNLENVVFQTITQQYLLIEMKLYAGIDSDGPYWNYEDVKLKWSEITK